MMLNPPSLHPTPRWRAVAEEQFRIVGLLIRPMAAVVAVLVLAATVLTGVETLLKQEGIGFAPELSFLVTPVAFLLPVAVWRGEYRFRHSYLASMPVDRTPHVLTKLAAGWAWLMVLLVAFLLVALAVTLVTGGEIGVYMRVLASDVPPGATPEEAVTFARRWTSPAWQWAVFFPGATVIYLLGSAVVLAGSRMWRWLAGIVAAWLFVVAAQEEGILLGGLAESFDDLIEVLFESRYGLETLVAGRENPVDLTTAEGRHVVSLWRRPEAGLWMTTVFLWMGLAIASVAAVVLGNRKD